MCEGLFGFNVMLDRIVDLPVHTVMTKNDIGIPTCTIHLDREKPTFDIQVLVHRIPVIFTETSGITVDGDPKIDAKSGVATTFLAEFQC